jgi:FtsZ-interacting cell division protein ZipA
MAKIEKKSIAELVIARNKRPSLEEIDTITQQIHTLETPVSTPVQKTTPKVQEKIVETPKVAEETIQTKRISVNATIPLYLKAKTRATLQGKTLMAYIIELMEDDTKNM